MIDFELQRWKYWRSKFVKEDITGREFCNYWIESGAFVSVLPMKSGKTRMIKMMADELHKGGEATVILTHCRFEYLNCRKYFGDYVYMDADKFLYSYGLNYYMNNLLIDNFTLINPNSLNTILNNNWKTVTMTGTLKCE